MSIRSNLPSGKTIKINKSLIDYYNPDYFNHPPDNISLPQFVEVKLKDLNLNSKLYIEIEKIIHIELYNAENDSLILFNKRKWSRSI